MILVLIGMVKGSLHVLQIKQYDFIRKKNQNGFKKKMLLDHKEGLCGGLNGQGLNLD